MRYFPFLDKFMVSHGRVEFSKFSTTDFNFLCLFLLVGLLDVKLRVKLGCHRLILRTFFAQHKKMVDLLHFMLIFLLNLQNNLRCYVPT